MNPPYRVGIQGAATLLGKEVHAALDERHFPSLPPALLGTPGARGAEGAIARTLTSLGDEAGLVEPCTPEALGDLDLIFLCGSAAEAQATAALAPARARLVDLTGALHGIPGAAWAGLEPGFDRPFRVAVVTHPAAQALAHLLERLARVGVPAMSAATVFEAASQRGWPGIQELQQQSTRLLEMQPLPETVFGCQVAFNLRPRLGPSTAPALGDIRRRITAEIGALGSAAPALTVIQAPIFHACLLSLYVRYASPPDMAVLLAAMRSPWLAPGEDYPDVISLAGSDTIALGPVRADAAGGFWLWAGVDNLRRPACSAVDAALVLLRQAAP